LTLSNDGNRLVGRVEHLKIDNNCEITSHGWPTGKIILTRK